MDDKCAYCDRYGYTERNKALAYFLEMEDLDFGTVDLAEELGISEKEVQNIIERFEKEGMLKKTRVFEKEQLYSINKDNKAVKKHIKEFKQVLKDVVREYKNKEQEKDKSPVRIPA